MLWGCAGAPCAPRGGGMEARLSPGGAGRPGPPRTPRPAPGELRAAAGPLRARTGDTAAAAPSCRGTPPCRWGQGTDLPHPCSVPGPPTKESRGKKTRLALLARRQVGERRVQRGFLTRPPRQLGKTLEEMGLI